MEVKVTTRGEGEIFPSRVELANSLSMNSD